MTRRTNCRSLLYHAGSRKESFFSPLEILFSGPTWSPAAVTPGFHRYGLTHGPPSGVIPRGAPARVTRAPPARGLPRRHPSLATPRPSLHRAPPCHPALWPTPWPLVARRARWYPVPGSPVLPQHPARASPSPPVPDSPPALLTPGLHHGHPSRAPPPWPRPGLPPRPPLRTPPPPSLPVSTVHSFHGLPCTWPHGPRARAIIPRRGPQTRSPPVCPRPGLPRPPPVPAACWGSPGKRGSCSLSIHIQ